MANSNNKIIFIILGVVGVIIAIPILLFILGMVGGFVYYQSGAN